MSVVDQLKAEALAGAERVLRAKYELQSRLSEGWWPEWRLRKDIGTDFDAAVLALLDDDAASTVRWATAEDGLIFMGLGRPRGRWLRLIRIAPTAAQWRRDALAQEEREAAQLLYDLDQLARVGSKAAT